jgi:hypothetical protein
VVEPAEAGRSQEMSKPVAAPIERGVAHPLAALRHYEGRLLRPDRSL